MSLISVVVPVYFNSASLAPLLERLQAMAAANSADRFEFVFVDDGSGDDSFEVLMRLAQVERRIRIVKLSRNFGAQDALYAGMQHARGDAVAVIAADLQDPPELLSTLVERWRAGSKVVLAIREGRNDPWLTQALARAFHVVYRRLAHATLPRGSVGFFLVDRQVCDLLNRIEENNTWIVGLLLWSGFEPALVPYERGGRAPHFGISKWSFGKRFKLFIDSIVGYSYVPLRIASSLGIVLSFVGLAYAVVIIATSVMRHSQPEGWTSLMVVVLVVSGVQLLMIGVVGEYVWRALDAARARPRFVVDRVVEPSHSQSEEVFLPVSRAGRGQKAADPRK